jgi:hypothetical protein
LVIAMKCTNLRSFRIRGDKGSIVLEAALVMPLFLGFVIALITLMRICIIEAAFDHALSDLTKQTAAHMYAIELMYDEALSTEAGIQIVQHVERIKESRDGMLGAENWVADYAAFVPDPILDLVAFEKRHRENIEQLTERTMYASLNKVFRPILILYTDSGVGGKKWVSPHQVNVTKVLFPDLKNKDEAYFGIEAEYRVNLFIPFFQKHVVLKARAYERAWVGTK